MSGLRSEEGQIAVSSHLPTTGSYFLTLFRTYGLSYSHWAILFGVKMGATGEISLIAHAVSAQRRVAA